MRMLWSAVQRDAGAYLQVAPEARLVQRGTPAVAARVRGGHVDDIVVLVFDGVALVRCGVHVCTVQQQLDHRRAPQLRAGRRGAEQTGSDARRAALLGRWGG